MGGPPTTAGPSALVIGSGMSGLAQAKVLSKYFSSVRVLERDRIAPDWTGETAEDASKVSREGCRVCLHRGVGGPAPPTSRSNLVPVAHIKLQAAW